MRLHGLTLFVLVILSYLAEAQQRDWFHSNVYSVSSTEVRQGKYTAKALSSTELTSNYQSPVNLFQGPRILFKFSINGKDNEMVSGKDHQAILLNQEFITPVIKFGQQYIDQTAIPDKAYLKPNTKFTVRLDMRDVLNAFKAKGYFTTFDGAKIYKEDFKGVFIGGSVSPLIWDFDNLATHPELQLKDDDGDGIFTINLTLNEQQQKKLTASSWKLTKNISAFPQYHSDYPIIDAIYNMSLEEMENAVEPDSTLRTGKEWAGVWTRDISYSIILAMATLQPKVAEYSLMRKVKNDRIIQDTGTGGSYPVSTDRMIWAVAAWELYKTTGDQAWLAKAYQIIKNSVEDDLKVAYDPKTGLVKGESSFLDWREQTYPKWMQPADIYESECLGTNAVHYQVNVALAEMAKLLDKQEDATKYAKIAENIKKGINTYLWIPEKGYYGQFLYGRHFKILSSRSEALGEALSVLFGIADVERQKQIIANTPVNDFGIPCIYPQIPNIPPYHNNAIWPFVQSYWSLAAAKAGNGDALVRSMSAIYRPAALFLTNKENFVASNGDFAGTQINSSNMLWSLSGNISMVYKVLFGMDYKANSLVFKPFVPKMLQGKRSLTNFKYRDALLNIEMEGYGNKIKTIIMDGEPLPNATVPATIKGVHQIKIVLANNEPGADRVKVVPDYFSPATPMVRYHTSNVSTPDYLLWDRVEGAVKYRVLKNGKEVALTSEFKTPVSSTTYAEYQVIAIDGNGITSFASEPIEIVPAQAIKQVEMEDIAPGANLPYQGFSGNGFIELSKEKNTILKFTITVAEAGSYAIDFKYANGNGPTNTENKCAVRTLKTETVTLGTVIFPQRGKEEWSNWGFSNSVQIALEKGTHTLLLTFEPQNENMNGVVNQAMLDYARVIRIN